MLNTYSMKMTGLKAASGDTKGLSGYYSGEYVELFYDRSTGEVWTVYQCSLGQNWWTEYHDSEVIKIGNISSPKTMQELANLIHNRVEYVKEQREWEAKINLRKTYSAT